MPSRCRARAAVRSPARSAPALTPRGPPSRAVDRDQIAGDAGSGERGRDDVGHRHHAHVGDGAVDLRAEVAVVDRHDQAHAGSHALDDQREAQRDAVIARDHDDRVDIRSQRAPDVAVAGRSQVDDVHADVVEHAAHDLDQPALADREDALLARRLVKPRFAAIRHRGGRRDGPCQGHRADQARRQAVASGA